MRLSKLGSLAEDVADEPKNSDQLKFANVQQKGSGSNTISGPSIYSNKHTMKV
jgi:hypothetical protein